MIKTGKRSRIPSSWPWPLSHDSPNHIVFIWGIQPYVVVTIYPPQYRLLLSLWNYSHGKSSITVSYVLNFWEPALLFWLRSYTLISFNGFRHEFETCLPYHVLYQVEVCKSVFQTILSQNPKKQILTFSWVTNLIKCEIVR